MIIALNTNNTNLLRNILRDIVDKHSKVKVGVISWFMLEHFMTLTYLNILNDSNEEEDTVNFFINHKLTRDSPIFNELTLIINNNDRFNNLVVHMNDLKERGMDLILLIDVPDDRANSILINAVDYIISYNSLIESNKLIKLNYNIAVDNQKAIEFLPLLVSELIIFEELNNAK